MVLNSNVMNLEELLRYKRLPKKDLLTYDVLSKLFMKYKSLLIITYENTYINVFTMSELQ